METFLDSIDEFSPDLVMQKIFEATGEAEFGFKINGNYVYFNNLDGTKSFVYVSGGVHKVAVINI